MIIKAQRISYSDKVAINTNSNVADINKCNASDLNEIKNVVNTNATSLENLETEVNEKGFICCTMNSAQTITTTGETNVRFDKIISQKGTDFTLSNYQITCNFDGFIEVSGQIQYSNAGNTGTRNLSIYNNSTIITRSLNAAFTSGGNKSAIAGTVIIPVSEGDIIKMSTYAVKEDTLNPAGNGTHITIKRVG